MTTTTRLMVRLLDRSGRAAIGCTILMVSTMFVASATPASAQDQSAATPGDAIIARKTMMNSLSDKMDDIEGAISAGKINLDRKSVV